MSIDGVGRPPVPKADIGSVGSSGPGAASGEKFQLEPATTPGVRAPSELLSQLERGEISVDTYVQARVDQALQAFEGRMAPEQLKLVRDALAEQMQTDPVVIELVRRATAGAPAGGETAG
jgi:hypothetical protein